MEHTINALIHKALIEVANKIKDQSDVFKIIEEMGSFQDVDKDELKEEAENQLILICGDAGAILKSYIEEL